VQRSTGGSAGEGLRDEGVPDTAAAGARPHGRDFIRTIVDRHLKAGRYPRVVTRFPPEPNGYLHIGHAKSICLNFGLAEEYGGRCHLRFDDTNPLTEDEEYTRAIQEDVRWLGFEYEPHLYFASDYFLRMYEVAEGLIREGKAYVDSSTEEEIREARGSVTEPGVPTGCRDRPVEENLDLFRRMRAGEFPDGAHVLRARIDLSSPNMLMRDPILYRIRHAHHYRTGDAWCLYPLYDFAHCLEDAFEGVTHSLCTLEFDNNRELYDWILDEAGFQEPRPRQYEFARLNLDFTVLSKRKLIRLVKEGKVTGWDDPRMPTVAGLRRRGVPPEAIRLFCDLIGVARADSRVDAAKLEFAVREVMNRSVPRYLGVLQPLPVRLVDWPEGKEGAIDAPLFPDLGPEAGIRTIPFGGRLFIDREDFALAPPRGWKRLAPGGAVRLRHAYVIRCREVVVDPATGEPEELLCEVDGESLDGPGAGWPASGAIHWVPQAGAVPAEVRLYDRLFAVPDPEEGPEGEDFLRHLNPGSLELREDALLEPALGEGGAPHRFQLERLGYFAFDPDSSSDRRVVNRVVTLRDGWARRRGGRAVPDAQGPDARTAAATQGGDPTPTPGPPSRAPTQEGPDDRLSLDRETAREADPGLAAAFRRYMDAGLSLEEADVLSGSRELSAFFDEAVEAHAEPGAVASWVVNDLPRELRARDLEHPPFPGAWMGRLASMVSGGSLPRRGGREVLREMVAGGGSPDQVVERLGLATLTDPEELEEVVRRILEDSPGKVAEYRGGRTALLGFFMGQVMRATGGSADPGVVRPLLEDLLQR